MGIFYELSQASLTDDAYMYGSMYFQGIVIYVVLTNFYTCDESPERGEIVILVCRGVRRFALQNVHVVKVIGSCLSQLPHLLNLLTLHGHVLP